MGTDRAGAVQVRKGTGGKGGVAGKAGTGAAEAAKRAEQERERINRIIGASGVGARFRNRTFDTFRRRN